MAIVLADVGADIILKVMFNNTRAGGGNNFKLKLFATNVTPTQTSTAGSFTEAAGGGYVAGGKALTNGSFTVTVGNDPSDATYTIQTWTFTGALTTNTTIYGYYLTDADDVLICAETITPFTPANNGDQLSITFKFQLSSGTPS
jgi:hypothetical protein